MLAMMKKKLALICALGALGFAMPAQAHAQKNVPSAAFEHELRSTVSRLAIIDSNYIKLAASKISPSKAKSIARKHVGGGEVVDISQTGDTYRVRVIAKDGQVVDVIIDANTGRVK